MGMGSPLTIGPQITLKTGRLGEGSSGGGILWVPPPPLDLSFLKLRYLWNDTREAGKDERN
jgi:hypothetical protein